MNTIETKDLRKEMLVRYPSSTVWRVMGARWDGKDSMGDRMTVTLRHGNQEKTVNTWEWFKWITAHECAPTCKLTGEHTGR